MVDMGWEGTRLEIRAILGHARLDIIGRFGGGL